MIFKIIKQSNIIHISLGKIHSEGKVFREIMAFCASPSPQIEHATCSHTRCVAPFYTFDDRVQNLLFNLNYFQHNLIHQTQQICSCTPIFPCLDNILGIIWTWGYTESYIQVRQFQFPGGFHKTHNGTPILAVSCLFRIGLD